MFGEKFTEAEVGDLEGDGISLPTPAYNKFRKDLSDLEGRQAVRGSGTADGKKRMPKEGKEYGIEHGGAGEFAGIRIISEGAARNAGLQGW